MFFRAVVWTDTLQFSAMIGAVLIVMVLGTIKMGGVGNVFEITDRSGRLVWFKLVENFKFLSQSIINILLVWILIPSSAVQYGPCRCGWQMWELLKSVFNVSFPCQHSQKPKGFVFTHIISKKWAIFYNPWISRALLIFSIGHLLVKLFSVYNGLLIFSNYEKCKPVFDGRVEKYDQIFPYFVMDIARSGVRVSLVCSSLELYQQPCHLFQDVWTHCLAQLTRIL